MTMLQVTSLALCHHHICLGRASGQVELYSRTKNAHVLLVWAKVGEMRVYQKYVKPIFVFSS